MVERAVGALEPGCRLVEARALTGGVSADVIGIEVVTAEGDRRRLVFRRHRDVDFKDHGSAVAAKEHRLLAALHRRGLAVPEPYAYVATDAETGPYLLMEWVDGSTGLTDDELPDALDQMAAFLVDLHALDPGAPDLPPLDALEDPALAVIPYLPATSSGRAVAATLATAGARRDGERPAVIHGDYWPGNVLWRDGRLVAVLDWEDASVGDPLADLATARVELACQYGDDAAEHFTTRYVARHETTIGALRLDDLLLWELYVSAAALATMAGWGLEPAEEARRRRTTERWFERAARAVTPPPL